MTDYLFDTYAWAEYIIGSSRGERVRRLLINSRNRFFIITPCLGELQSWALRESHDFSEIYALVRANAETVDLSEEEWIQAGRVRHQQRKFHKDFGLIDAAILVKQYALRAMVVTGDPHFKGLPSVVILSPR
jgi:predicted nucleic acid-binding protein